MLRMYRVGGDTVRRKFAECSDAVGCVDVLQLALRLFGRQVEARDGEFLGGE